MSTGIWRIVPLRLTIMKILEKRNGLILENELRMMLEKEVGPITDENLNRELMNLEINAKIIVSRIKKSERKISVLNKKEHSFLTIGED